MTRMSSSNSESNYYLFLPFHLFKQSLVHKAVEIGGNQNSKCEKSNEKYTLVLFIKNKVYFHKQILTIILFF